MSEYLLCSHSCVMAVALSERKCEEQFEVFRKFLETDQRVYCLGCFHQLLPTFCFFIYSLAFFYSWKRLILH